MKRQHDGRPVRQVAVHPLDESAYTLGVAINRGRQIDDQGQPYTEALIHCRQALKLMDPANHRAQADTWDSIGSPAATSATTVKPRTPTNTP